MSPFESIEGVDYIFDRYAFINNILLEANKAKIEIRSAFEGVSVEVKVDQFNAALSYQFTGAAVALPGAVLIGPQSSDAEISAAIKTARVLYHADKYQSMPTSTQKDAARQYSLIEKAAEILENPDLRPLYTERLLRFYTDSPQKVSDNGTMIVVLGEERFSLDALLSDEIPDTSQLEKKIAEMTQFDESRVATAKQIYDVQPGNPAFQKMYREALTLKFIYLDLVESTIWGKLGFSDKKDLVNVRPGTFIHADAYVDAVQSEIDRVKNEIVPLAIDQRNDALRIGTAAPLLLLTDQALETPPASSLPTTLTPEQLARITERAHAHIDDRERYILDVAGQKQMVLNELCRVSDIETLVAPNGKDHLHHILPVMTGRNGSFTFLMMQANLEDGTLSQVENTVLEPGTLYDDAARDVLKAIPNLHIIHINPELAASYPITESIMLAERLGEQWRAIHKPAPAGPGVPAPV